jgi:hypothetical protein
MTLYRVPVHFEEQPTRTRWSEVIEALGDLARKEMTLTGGEPTVRPGEPAYVFVSIGEGADVGAAGGATPEETAANVVARALLDAGYTIETSRVDVPGTTTVPE